ncbi:Prolamin-like domain containing protein [Parasponia andersonii]|uniref:Prolamin-like domain containing protein n=1 Tax=Parasponia andersonii TaxID=3476 RepID=A0A2P5A6S7_PARAD|nr:Prolamin-like domain containing protein [Parasponia andersonii]
MAWFQTHSSPIVVFALGILLGAMVVLVSLVASAIPVAPPPTDDNVLQECEVKIATCGIEIFNAVVKNVTVSTTCCHRLVFMGKKCHDGLVEHLLSQPSFQGNKAQVFASARQTWDYCISVP